MLPFLKYGAAGAFGILVAFAASLWLGYLSAAAIAIVALAGTAVAVVAIRLFEFVRGGSGERDGARKPDADGSDGA